MSKLSEMLKELCPDGVEYKKLGEIGTLIRGKRFVKNDFIEDGVSAIHYGELYTHYGIFASEVKTHIRQEIASKMRYAHQHDIVIVGAGETIEDIGIGVAWLGKMDVAVHDACYIFHHDMNPVFISYVLRTEDYHRQLKKYITTGKISSISANGLGQAIIPVPPLAIQNEIVKLLDNFTELTAELVLRKKQYNFYRDSLLNFVRVDDTIVQTERKTELEIGRVVSFLLLSELAEIGTGGSNTNEGLSEGTYPFFVRSQEVRWKNTYEYDETAIITSGDSVGVGKIFHYIEGKYALHQRAYRIHVFDERLLPKFYYMKASFYRYITQNAVQSSVTSIRRPMLDKYPIPIPPLEVQQKIVSILDRFDALCHDLTQGLPAEIAARKKQYEYYRDKLLTFPRKGESARRAR